MFPTLQTKLFLAVLYRFVKAQTVVTAINRSFMLHVFKFKIIEMLLIHR